MNPNAVLALPLLAVVLWLLSRRWPRLTASAGLHGRATADPVTALFNPVSGGSATQVTATSPLSTTLEQSQREPAHRRRQQHLGQLGAQLGSSPDQRLDAVQQLAAWGDRATLPLLRRALRDPHPQVVHAAALAIERFRGRPAAAGGVVGQAGPGQPVRRPRNARPRS